MVMFPPAVGALLEVVPAVDVVVLEESEVEEAEVVLEESEVEEVDVVLEESEVDEVVGVVVVVG